MTSAGLSSVASWHPAPSSFPHQPVFTVASNSFRFIALQTLPSNGNSLPFSLQQITHSFSSHGIRPRMRARFSSLYFPVSNSLSAKSFSYRTYKKRVRNPIICRTYKNKGLITLVFAALTKITRVSPSNPTLERSALASFPSQRYPCPVCATRAPRGSLATFALNPNESRSDLAHAHI